jgi:hypothetical protein
MAADAAAVAAHGDACASCSPGLGSFELSTGTYSKYMPSFFWLPFAKQRRLSPLGLECRVAAAATG